MKATIDTYSGPTDRLIFAIFAESGSMFMKNIR